MPQPRLSRTVADLQAKRGDASGSSPRPENSVEWGARFDSGVVSPSTPTTVTATPPASPESTREPSTSVSSTKSSSSPARTLPLSTSVREYLFSPRPIPTPDLSSPGGEHLLKYSKLMGGIPLEHALELLVGWGMSFSYTWGEKPLEELLLFHRDNCGF